MEIEALRPSSPTDAANVYNNGEADPESPNSLHDPPVHEQQHHDDDDQVERTSNAFQAAGYSITAIVGVGVLGLPQAMVFLQWGPGLVILVVAFFQSYFTLKQLVRLHEDGGIRYETYYKLGQAAFGDRAGLWIILPLQLFVEVTLDILCMVAAGEAMNRIYDHFTECNPNQLVHIFVWFAVFAAIQIILSLVEPTFESIKWIVIIAAIMSICYSTIAWITVLAVSGPEEEWRSANNTSTFSPPKINHSPPKHVLVDHCVLKSDDLSDAYLVFQAFNAIGVVAFAYTAHSVVLEIQNGIPSTPERSSEAEMMRGVNLAYVVVAICYLPMANAFYKTYGNQISQNALSFLQYQTGASGGLVTAANLMLIIHLIGSYQIFGMPVFKVLEIRYKILIEPMFSGGFPCIKRSIPFLIRPLYIVLTTVLAMLFPFFSPLLGFLGGFAVAPTAFILSRVIYLKIKKPRRWSRDWWHNWGCIVLGAVVMIVASIGGGYVLITNSLRDTKTFWTSNWRHATIYLTKNWNNPSLLSPNTWPMSPLYSRCDINKYRKACHLP